MDESFDVKPVINEIGRQVISCCEAEDTKVYTQNLELIAISIKEETTQSYELDTGQLMLTRDRQLSGIGCDYIKIQQSNIYENETGSPFVEDDVKPLTCFKCNYACYDSALMESHLMNHDLKKEISFNECSYSSSTNVDFERPHGQQNVVPTREKPFSCIECGYSCTTKFKLMKHIKIHLMKKGFSCTECTYAFNSKYSLKHHMMTHTGEKPFSCTECTYVCIRKAHLKLHMMKHTREKPFSCTECNYVSSQKAHIKRHTMTHTGVKPFSCTECSYVSNRKSNLNCHMMTHTGEKPFSCIECTYVCTLGATLRQHLKSHRKETFFL